MIKLLAGDRCALYNAGERYIVEVVQAGVGEREAYVTVKSENLGRPTTFHRNQLRKLVTRQRLRIWIRAESVEEKSLGFSDVWFGDGVRPTAQMVEFVEVRKAKQ